MASQRIGPPAPGRVAIVARLELVRTVRRSLGWSLKGAILLGLLPIVLLGYSVGLGVGAYLVGPPLRAGEVPVTYPRAAFAGLFALIAFFTAQRAIKRTGRLDNAAAILVAVPVGDALLGQVIAEYCRAAAFFVVPSLFVAVGLGIGTGSALAGAATFAGLLALALLGVVVGYAAGLAAMNVVARSAFVAAHRTAIGLTVTLVLFGGYVYGTADPATGGALVGVLPVLPPAWVADLVLLALSAGDPAPAAGGFASLAVGIPATTAVAGVLADRLWFVDPVQPGERVDGSGERGRLERLLAPRIGRQATAVALKSWRRAARAPFTVQYAVVPFFGLVTPLQRTVQTGQVPGYTTAMLALACAWATGAAFTLNPVGGQGAMLPVVLSANVPGRRFLGGLTLAGVAIGVPVTVVAVAVAGAVATTPTWLVAAWVVAGAVFAMVAPAVGSVAGVTFPKFEYTRVGSNREAIVPSIWAFLLYSVALGVVVAPSLVAASPFLLDALAGLAGIPAPVVAGFGFGAAVLLAVIAAPVGFRYAVARFEGHHLE